MMSGSWVCCQLGAREHYAVARAVHSRGGLQALVTDAWVPPGSAWNLVPGAERLRERYSADLATASVVDFTSALVRREAVWRLRRQSGWPLMIARNEWFMARAAAAVSRMVDVPVVFAHSYAALQIFTAAKAKGARTILGQIDPGPRHLDILRNVAARWPEFGPALPEPETAYFDAWRQECRLADRIVVNSEWSRALLMEAGIDSGKIAVVPLPYETDEAEGAFERRYPEAFSPMRPMRLLFVGSVATFKGVPSLLEALELLTDLPIEVRLAGPIAATIPDRFAGDRRVRILGALSRSAVMAEYRDADVLVFPSHSDGFGMAQVEARAWHLPVIASPFAGRVVEDGVDGVLLPEITATAIASAIRRLHAPRVLTQLAGGATHQQTLAAFGEALVRLAGSR